MNEDIFLHPHTPTDSSTRLVTRGTSPRTIEAQSLLTHKLKMPKDVRGVCYHYFVDKFGFMVEFLFMWPTFLNQCALLSQLGNYMLCATFLDFLNFPCFGPPFLDFSSFLIFFDFLVFFLFHAFLFFSYLFENLLLFTNSFVLCFFL